MKLPFADPARTVIDILDIPKLASGTARLLHRGSRSEAVPDVAPVSQYRMSVGISPLDPDGPQTPGRVVTQRNLWINATITADNRRDPTSWIDDLHGEWSIAIGVIERATSVGGYLAASSPTLFLFAEPADNRCAYGPCREVRSVLAVLAVL